MNVLSIRPFRRLWIATSLSSLGDWLSLLALTAEAAILAKRGIAAQTSAVSGVWLTSLLRACCSARWRERWRTGSTAGST